MRLPQYCWYTCTALAILVAGAGSLFGQDPPANVPKDNQGAPPVDQSAAPKDSDDTIVVGLSEVFNLRHDSALPIKDAFVDRDKVVGILGFQRNDISVKLIGRGFGKTRVTLIDQKEVQKVYKIQVVPTLNYLNAFLQRQFPDASLKLSAGGDNILVVEGIVETPLQVEAIHEFLKNLVGRNGQVINQLRMVGPMQVQLDVTIARIDRTALRRMNFNFLANDQNYFLGSQLGNLIGVPGVLVRGGDAAAGALKVFQPSATVANQVLTGSVTGFAGFTKGNTALFGFLEILKQNGVAKILANPTLVTYNGRPAEFLVGGEQPIPQTTFAAGVATTAIDFKAFGTRLTFVPVIVGEGKIRLDVLPEVSTTNTAGGITTGGISVPQFVTQRLHTTVEMESGQTLVLGGLLQTVVEGQIDKVPVLGDMPGIGAAFRKLSHKSTDTELIIVVTPRLVDPLGCHQKPPVLPGQETRSPTDIEFYGLGRIETPVVSPREMRNAPRAHPGNGSILDEHMAAWPAQPHGSMPANPEQLLMPRTVPQKPMTPLPQEPMAPPQVLPMSHQQAAPISQQMPPSTAMPMTPVGHHESEPPIPRPPLNPNRGHILPESPGSGPMPPINLVPPAR